jgi:hypothetical protein
MKHKSVAVLYIEKKQPHEEDISIRRIEKGRKAKEDQAGKEHKHQALKDAIEWNKEGIQRPRIKSFYCLNGFVTFEHMNKHNQQSMENTYGTYHQESNESIGSDVCPDGYSGPRARMVLDPSDRSIFGRISSGTDGDRMDFLEKGKVGAISFGMIALIIVSIAVLPLVAVGYVAHRGVYFLSHSLQRNKWNQ